MEGNDIGSFLTSSVAVMFEGLILIHKEDAPAAKRKFWQKPVPQQGITIDDVVRSWKTAEMPIKSLSHMVNQLKINVDVYTYYDSDYIEPIEHWLARKGISVTVYSYEDPEGLMDDFRYNRDVHTLYTPFESDAAYFGPRCTVMSPGSTWGV